MQLGLKQKVGRGVHLFKTLCRQHHENLAVILRAYVPHDAVVFDVGGHAGQFAKIFSALAPDGAVFTFEPASYARSILQVMAGVKSMDNLYVLPFGLGAQPDQLTLNVPIKKKGNVGYGLSFIGDNKGDAARYKSFHTERAYISTIDSMAEVLGLKRLDFIKADIEGFEFFMLQGAEKTLQKFRPALLLELSDRVLARHGQTVGEVLAWLSVRGYDPQYLDEANAAIRPVQPGETEGDFLFLPRQA
jgi:FkbM family methyltransferase